MHSEGRAYARPSLFLRTSTVEQFASYAEAVSEPVPSEVPGARKRGRPKGSTTGSTKSKILKAAAKEFARAGFEGASLRSVARRASVDPALVHHYFKNKSELFIQTMRIPVNPGDIIGQAVTAPLDDLGYALTSALVSTWQKPTFRAPAIAMVRGLISSNNATKILKPFIQKEIFSRIGSRLPEETAQERIALVASQFIGLIIARHVVALEPLASMDDDQLIELIAPTIQRYLTGDLPIQKH